MLSLLRRRPAARCALSLSVTSTACSASSLYLLSLTGMLCCGTKSGDGRGGRSGATLYSLAASQDRRRRCTIRSLVVPARLAESYGWESSRRTGYCTLDSCDTFDELIWRAVVTGTADGQARLFVTANSQWRNSHAQSTATLDLHLQ
jgi:hypothetical protein